MRARKPHGKSGPKACDEERKSGTNVSQLRRGAHGNTDASTAKCSSYANLDRRVMQRECINMRARELLML